MSERVLLPLVLAAALWGARPTPLRAQVIIEREAWPPAAREYVGANYRLHVIERGPNRVTCEVVVWPDVASSAPYPVSPVYAEHLGSDEVIQADHPLIVAQAADLVEGATTQAEVVERVVAFVREHVAYTPVAARDAVSVLETGEGDCVGYGNLSLALLRAAGIPARRVLGVLVRQGSWENHCWVDVHHGDVGWISVDPQMTVSPRHVRGGLAGDSVVTWLGSQ
jgi:transglutaminase-like putative cysteine protease